MWGTWTDCLFCGKSAAKNFLFVTENKIQKIVVTTINASIKMDLKKIDYLHSLHRSWQKYNITIKVYFLTSRQFFFQWTPYSESHREKCYYTHYLKCEIGPYIATRNNYHIFYNHDCKKSSKWRNYDYTLSHRNTVNKSNHPCLRKYGKPL